jgi:3(or 17)beta-hydroxysteroid dehydrogenase
MSRLTGKTALVTGAARGLGAATCRAMAAEGASIIVTDLNVAEGQALVAAFVKAGNKAMFLEQNTTDEARWSAVFAEGSAALGPVNVLVNNAGIAMPGTIESTSFADWRKVISVNLDGVFLGTKAGVIHMKAHGGSIINMSSIEGFVGDPALVAYNASKGGVRLMSKSAALYCMQEKYPVRVNSLHPGYVLTEMVKSSFKASSEFEKRIRSKIPMGRLGTEEEIANTVVFMASDESSYMSGTEVVIDGGYTAS